MIIQQFEMPCHCVGVGRLVLIDEHSFQDGIPLILILCRMWITVFQLETATVAAVVWRCWDRKREGEIFYTGPRTFKFCATLPEDKWGYQLIQPYIQTIIWFRFIRHSSDSAAPVVSLLPRQAREFVSVFAKLFNCVNLLLPHRGTGRGEGEPGGGGAYRQTEAPASPQRALPVPAVWEPPRHPHQVGRGRPPLTPLHASLPVSHSLPPHSPPLQGEVQRGSVERDWISAFIPWQRGESEWKVWIGP